MAANAGLMLGWTRAVPGHEAESQSKFGECLGYLTKLQTTGDIESFEPVVLAPHGGDLNGFILIRGDTQKLNQLRATEAWKQWVSWGSFHMSGFGATECLLGTAIQEAMQRSAKFIKK